MKETYAEVVLKAGINLKEGQNLLINCHGTNYDFARILAQKAYSLGAGYVDIALSDNYLLKERLKAQEREQLLYFPNYKVAAGYQMLAEDWARISIDDTEESDVLKEVDSSKLGLVSQKASKVMKPIRNSYINDEHPWCVICAPGPRWAEKVLGPTADEEALIETLTPILRLNKSDPVSAWREYGETLLNRAKTLSRLKLKNITFFDDGSELTITLAPLSIWQGGPSKLPDGRLFLPNIPTEEVFTTPDYRLTEGRVTIKRVVNVMGQDTEGAWFEFKEGKVVKFGAKSGKSILEEYLAIDEGAGMVGEVALVDNSSVISQSGLLFNSILYDENASSHIALGCGYPACFSSLPYGSKDEGLRKIGCNVSLVHTDFMIGSEETKVVGTTAAGDKITIMESGCFKI